MAGRRSIFFEIVLTLLFLIIILQIQSISKRERFYDSLNYLVEKLESESGENVADNSGRRPEPIRADYEQRSEDEGDWLVWAFRVEPKTLNNISADSDIYTRWITIPYIQEPLLMYDYDEVKLKGWLAEKYEVSGDGKEITFYLRDDIYFSDGVPVTADDVVFTFETVMNPKVDAANLSNQYFDLSRVEKVSEKVVKIYMKRPYFKQMQIASLSWDLGVYPKHVYEFTDANDFNQRVSEPVGSGPFVFEKWDKGQQMVMKRNENYWGRRPSLDKIVFKFITNDAAALQALQSGDVDMMIPDPEQFADVYEDEGFRRRFRCLKYWTPWTPFYYMGWNQKLEFFQDRRVRLAMTHIINRDEIVKHLLRGHAEVITSSFYKFGGDNDPNIEAWPYDLKRAKELLDEAGWVDSDGDGIRDKGGKKFRFTFTYSSSSTFYERLAKLLKDEARKVGIDVVLNPLEWSVLIPRLSDREVDATVMGWGGDVIEDPYQIFHSSQIGNRGSNYYGFSNAEADAIMEQARGEIDEVKRQKLYRRLHGILHWEQPYTFLYTRPTFRILDRRFKNVNIHKLGLKYWEWYVPREEQKYR